MRRILLCSTNEAVRKRWASALGSLGDIYVFAYAVTIAELDEAIDAGSYDLAMIHRNMVGAEQLQALCRKKKNLRLFILADRPENKDGMFCFSQGCSGYANTYISSGRLHAALQTISQGLAWVGESLMQYILGGLAQAHETSAGQERENPAVFEKLSPREKEIAELIAGGLSNLAIAEHLGITERTVKAHLSTVYGKTKTKGRLDLALRIRNMG